MTRFPYPQCFQWTDQVWVDVPEPSCRVSVNMPAVVSISVPSRFRRRWKFRHGRSVNAAERDEAHQWNVCVMEINSKPYGAEKKRPDEK